MTARKAMASLLNTRVLVGTRICYRGQHLTFVREEARPMIHVHRSLPIAIVLLSLSSVLAGCGDNDTNESCSSDCADASLGDDVTPAEQTLEGDPAFTVEISTGKVGGSNDGGARRFLKIPYAKSPTGDLRWRAAADPEPWDGVRYETEFALGCPQQMDQGAPASNNEDCLFLNVWAPDPKPTDAPVMFWIHGGGNFSGAAGIPVPTKMDLSGSCSRTDPSVPTSLFMLEASADLPPSWLPMSSSGPGPVPPSGSASTAASAASAFRLAIS